MDLAKTLSYNYVFRGVPFGTVAFLAALAEVRSYEGGETILRQYDRSEDVLVILEGEAVTKSIQDDFIASFGPGSILGEMALLDGESRSATVVSKGRTKAAILRASDIRSAMDADPVAAEIILGNLAKVLCRRLRSMNAKLDAAPMARTRTEALAAR